MLIHFNIKGYLVPILYTHNLKRKKKPHVMSYLMLRFKLKKEKK